MKFHSMTTCFLSKHLLFSGVLISILFSQLQALETASEIWEKIGELGEDKAKQKLKVLAEKEPADFEGKYYYASILLGFAPTEIERDEATKYLSEILEKKPSEPGWLLSWTNIRMGQSHAQLASLYFQGKNKNVKLRKDLKPFVKGVVDRQFRFLETEDEPQKFSDADWPISREQMEEDLEQLFQLYSENWSYVEEKEKQTGKSLPDLLKAGKSKLGDVESIEDFEKVLKEFVGALEDGHSSCWVNYERFRKQRALPFSFQKTKEGYCVGRVSQGVDQIQVGDLICSIQGVAIDDLVEKSAKSAFVSSPHAREYRAIRNLFRCDEKEIKVEIERERGKRKRIRLTTVSYDSAPWLSPRGGKDWLTWSQRADGVGMIKINTFHPYRKKWETATRQAWPKIMAPAKKQIRQAVNALQGCQSVVIDLRGNGGGLDPLGIYLANHFLENPFAYYSLQTRMGPHWKKYRGAVVLVIDEGCFSASDCFITAMVKNHPNVKVVGRQNCAGAGQPTKIGQLTHSKCIVVSSTCKVWDSNGNLLEGNPVPLTEKVMWTQKDLIEGNDPDIEAAIKLALGQK